MESEGFVLGIQPAKLLKTSGNSGFFSLNFNTYFSVYIYNQNGFFCDVDISIDGVDMGTFRIAQRSEYLIERPGIYFRSRF